MIDGTPHFSRCVRAAHVTISALIAQNSKPPDARHRRGRLGIVASIEEPLVIAKIRAHLECTAPDRYAGELPLGARAPPGQVPLL